MTYEVARCRLARLRCGFGVLSVACVAACASPGLRTTVPEVAPVGERPEDASATTNPPISDVSATQQALPIAQRGINEMAPAAAPVKQPVADTPAVTALSAAPMWDIDVHAYESDTRVAHYLARFGGSERDYVQSRLSDGTRFEPMIRQTLRNGGLPGDMYYLAFVESGFDPNACSRAAAVGLWQFMPSTARDFGLRVDWWVDERRDPVRSTRAAVDFIRSLREQFGSIYLAAAAYNGGPGRIAKGLSRYAKDLNGSTGDDLFFALAGKQYLKNETREYVPQFIAAALIAKDTARYGLRIEARSAFAYDSEAVPALTSLAAIARAAGSTVADLQRLNPQILRGMTPPRSETMVRIPTGSAARFDSVFALLPDSVRVGARIVRTKGGETAAGLAKLTSVQPRRIAQFNPSIRRTEAGTFRADQTIYVPKAEVVLAVTAVPGRGKQ